MSSLEVLVCRGSSSLPPSLDLKTQEVFAEVSGNNSEVAVHRGFDLHIMNDCFCVRVIILQTW